MYNTQTYIISILTYTWPPTLYYKTTKCTYKQKRSKTSNRYVLGILYKVNVPVIDNCCIVSKIKDMYSYTLGYTAVHLFVIAHLESYILYV